MQRCQMRCRPYENLPEINKKSRPTRSYDVFIDEPLCDWGLLPALPAAPLLALLDSTWLDAAGRPIITYMSLGKTYSAQWSEAI